MGTKIIKIKISSEIIMYGNKSETISVQNNGIRTKYIKTKIHFKTSSECRQRENKSETIYKGKKQKED